MIPRANALRNEPNSKVGSSVAGDVLKRVLVNLADCRAELVSLSSPWVSQIPAGWFYVYSVRSGGCQLVHGDRVSTPSSIQSGDTVILPHCREHRLRDCHTTEWSHANQVSWFDTSRRMHNVPIDESQRQTMTNIVVCRFPKPNGKIRLPLHVLPETLICKQHDTESLTGVKSTIEILEQELGQSSATPDVIEHLVKALILQACRANDYRTANPRNAHESMTIDRPIAKAIELMGSRLEMAWTVASLATAVGVSRSTFAANFVDQVGMTPLNYLRQERMQQAADLLCDESLGIKEVSALVGYTSESAFNSTFKKWFGTTPGLFRRDRHR